MSLAGSEVSAAIGVSDMGRATEFSEGKLGLSGGVDQGDGGRTYTCGGGTRIHVFPSPGNAGGSGATLAAWRVDDIETTVGRADREGRRSFEQYGEPFSTDEKGDRALREQQRRRVVQGSGRQHAGGRHRATGDRRARLRGSPAAQRAVSRVAARGAAEQPRAAELRLRRMDGERAAQVARQPDVQHLAALALAGTGPATAAGAGAQAAPLPAHADRVRVPARDRPARRRPELAARHAEHRRRRG